MNLQTDNMKRILLFFSLMLLLGNIKGLAQSIVIDPAMIGTLVYSHQEQQGTYSGAYPFTFRQLIRV